MVAELATSATLPAHDTAKAVGALLALVPSGRIALCAIVPDGPVEGRTFTLPQEAAEIAAWIEPWQGVANLHWTLNEPKPPAEQKGLAGRVIRAPRD